MNQHLIQINNNCAVVSDEKGNLSLISKRDDSYDFEEILLKENELEDLSLKLQKSKEKLSYNKQNIICGEIANINILGVEFFLYVFLHSAVLPKVLFAIMAITYALSKGMASLTWGTRIGRYIKQKKLTSDIEKMELELPKLERELMKIKEKSKYKVSISTIDEDKTKTPVEKTSPEISLPIDSYISEEHNKVRVLSLSKRK